MNKTKIIDLLTGKDVWNSYLFLKDSQWFSKEKLKQIQCAKLHRLLDHCYLNVPYYTRYMNERGLKPSSSNCIDVLKQLPVISKEIIKEHYNDFIPKNLMHIAGVKASQTSGTTGNILVKRNDSASRSVAWAAYKRFENWMGYTDKDKAIFLMGSHVSDKSRISSIRDRVMDSFLNRISLSAYDSSVENLDKIIRVLNKYDVKLIRSYSQFMFFLAKTFEEQGHVFDVPAITLTAEPVTEYHRVLLKRVFNASVFDQYGCGEIGGIAFECERHEGLHITEEKVIVEVNDNNELIITDLDNYAMPFIKYWNADQAILSDHDCICGRKHRLIKQIMGRTCDYIVGINKQYLHWGFFLHLVFDSGIASSRGLKKFQVVQRGADCIVFRYVADDLSAAEKQMMKETICERLGDMQVEFSKEKDIENSASGKYRLIVSEI